MYGLRKLQTRGVVAHVHNLCPAITMIHRPFRTLSTDLATHETWRNVCSARAATFKPCETEKHSARRDNFNERLLRTTGV